MNAKNHPARRSTPMVVACVVGGTLSGSILIGWAAMASHAIMSTPITVGEAREFAARLADRRNDPRLLVRFERRVRGTDADKPFVEVFVKLDQGDLAMQ